MHLSVIVPPGCEDLLVGEGSPVKSVMCFADIAYKNPDYLNFYAQYKGWKVMDNEIYEKLPPLEPTKLAAVAHVIQPDVLIIPDVRGDVDATLAYADAYLPQLRLIAGEVGSDIRLCGVVQGRTVDEIRRCAEFWAAAPVGMIAVPMRVDGRELSRLEVYRDIVRPLLPSYFRVHLLGVEKWPYDDEERLAQYPEIVSCDTAEPTSSTLHMHPYTATATMQIDVDRPPAFMNDPGHKEDLRNNKELLWRNFSWLQHKFMAPTATRTVSPPTDAPTTE